MLDDWYKSLVNNKIEYTSMHVDWVVTVDEFTAALVEQEKGKAAGQDEVPMETFVYEGQRILRHVTWYFSLFLKFGFIPKSMSAVNLVLIVKNKGSNLCDANKYRAIVISTAIFKLFK